MSRTKQKLTDTIVAKATLPDGKAEAVIWDGEVTGFGLRLRGAAKSYIVSYRPAGAGRSSNAKRVKLGTPETIKTATEARRLARAVLGKVAAGGDPASERVEQKRRSKSQLGELLDRYDEDLARRRYVARKMVMALLRTRLAKHLDKDVGELRGADFVAIIEKLERDGMVGAADAFRSRCRAFLSWCMVKQKVLDANPLYGYRRERATRADRLAKAQHGRALTDKELAAVWKAADPEKAFGRFVRFLVLTGCRRGEGAGLKRQMIEKDVIVLPPQFVKQGRSHIVPISPALRQVLDACPIVAGSDLVFPSGRTGGPMSGWNKLTAALVKTSGVAFSFHDLRRTFRTGLSRLGVDNDLAELALGHARTDLEARYNRDDARDALRQAFTAWAAHVEKVVAAEEEQPQGAFA